MKTVTDFPAVAEKKANREEVQAELAEVEREQHDLRTAKVETAKDDVAAKAKRFLSGEGIDERPHVDTREKRLAELHQKGKILKAALGIATRELAVAEEVASRELMEEASADLEQVAQDFATKFSEAAQKAKAFKDFRNELEAGGVSLSVHYPAIALGQLDLLDRNSWANRVLTDLKSDYNAKVDRSVLEAKEKSTEMANAAEAKARHRAGHGYAAGPKGIWKWLPGGKKEQLLGSDPILDGGVVTGFRA